MRLFAAAPLLLASAPAALGQNLTVLTELLQALTSSGHNRLATIATQLNSTSVGQSVLSQLSSGGPFVLFAPTDAAFDSAPSNVTSDNDLLADVVAYHVAQGNFSGDSPAYPNTTLGRTLLHDPKYVQLEGNRSQVLAWAVRADGKVHVLNQRNDSTVTNTTAVGNITIHTVDHVLNFPEPLAATVPADNVSLTGIEDALRALQVPNAGGGGGGESSLFDTLNAGLRGFTFFAPNTSAIQQAQSALAALAGNTSALQALFLNHLINGTTVYSPELAGPDQNQNQNQNHTSAAGEPLRFVLNATGHYVTSGNTTARLVQPDVLLPNGVIHVVDRVLANTDADARAASSAASSASSAATQSTSATAPIGYSATATLAGPGGSASASSTSGSGSGSGGSSNAARGGVYGVPSVARSVGVGVGVGVAILGVVVV
ncbi:FAS1 domain-containing protein [Trametes maxima]|nr:FAS1 domain-containing protein [Trametes maxima]